MIGTSRLLQAHRMPTLHRIAALGSKRLVSIAATNSTQSVLTLYSHVIFPQSPPPSLTIAARSKSTLNLGPSLDMDKFQALDESLVRKIYQELVEADTGADGRISDRDIKRLLQKHTTTFNDKEIVNIGELFYASKAGGTVSIERFIEAVDFAAASMKDEESTKGKLSPLGIGTCVPEYMYVKDHANYTPEDLDVKLTHVEPQTTTDKAALALCKLTRVVFDTTTGWNRGSITTDKILNRAIFLETVAAIPGMVAAIVRHFRSLRQMQRDGGMLNMFLEEANNERMHLLTFIKLKDPGYIFRASVIGGQLAFGTMFLTAYSISPAFCHRFVGYIEEEACHTYTKIIEEIENAPKGSDLAIWRTEVAPAIARSYWKLGEDGKLIDMVRAVRADEAEHRDVNHAVSGLKDDTINPLYNPEQKLNDMLKAYLNDIMSKSGSGKGANASVAS
uniref:Uncharacterized protein n=1 Tax=Pseudictyota dubia TaxID=2749911 RepID=A0A7R9VSB6_9STRA|eukprot:CAMPEP_0197442714 /NCGR_PEP_ID=MMETSP1175-20131217/8672_1 /TAXON_ID=1003142 /ORGANISM="Triceratium dubium, Strain CCMP147" /LENGTH=447 /DNA_ID=CAMNT_0042973243 /DNA_START=46 /DNA_END=1389 /DNA_ORIENTATION=+